MAEAKHNFEELRKPQDYPKAKYHASFAPVVVASPDEERYLGPEWYDHPSLDPSLDKGRKVLFPPKPEAKKEKEPEPEAEEKPRKKADK